MLNPNATEFRPSDPPKTIPQRSSKGEKYKDKKKQRTQQQSKADQNLASSQPSESHLQSAPKTSDGKKKQQGKSRKNAPSSTGGSSRRATGRRESAQQNSLAPASTTQPFDQPVKFITIEEAIDPVFRMRPDMREMSAIGDDGRARGKLVHGYERYIEWISRCLKAFETITIVGMDKAIADVVSLVTILQHRGIGEHEEVETFTIEQDVRRVEAQTHCSLHLPIANNNPSSPDATELAEVRDIEYFLATLDARNNLRSVTSLETGSDDESSLSSNMSAQDKVYSTDDDDLVHGHTLYREDGRDEAQQRLFHDDLENGNDNDDGISTGKNGRKNSRWICIVFLGILLLGWIIWTFVISGLGQVHGSEEATGAKHIDFDDLYNGSFTPRKPYLEWVKNDPRDGLFTYSDPLTGDILLETIEQGTVDTLVKQSYLQLDEGYLEVSSFEISQDAEYLMLWTNVSSQWRHSVRANIYIYNIENRTLFPLTENSTVYGQPRISYAVWSPTGHQVAYVMDNDLYVTDLETERRITFDGSATIFNGVPDWVYEEEVFGTDHTLWWSPDSTHIAYLRFNETAVPEYHVPFYTKSNSTYPDEVSIKYPKAGAPNPLVSLHVYSLLDDTTIMVTKNATSQSTAQMIAEYRDFDDDDRLITDVVWATETHTHLLFKQMNRVQDHEMTSLLTIKSKPNESTVEVARRYQPTDGGWIEMQQSIVYLSSKNKQIRYIDLADDGNGYLHLAIFTAGDKKQDPVWLTSGEWEVVTGTVVMDPVRQLLHFASTERSPLERHLYSISLKDDDPASTKVCLTCPEDPEEHAYYTASFSPKAGYYVLNYEGPEVPKTVVKKVDNSTFESVLEDNRNLKALLSEYELPRARMVTVQSGGVEMNAVELLPPDFNAAEKYPVLFHVYGGPGSQLVSYQFDLSWHTFIASKLRYIVVTVDGRGTGFRGREYRTCVRGRLGELETIDQVNAAKHWATLDYVDPSRIAIWGWSYGGYMTTKVIESNDGVFSTGMAVAPVTDWRFYDSIYTERYMLTPEMNPDGYTNSAVNNMTGFNNAKYLLVHGTGDDNVHFQHSAVLVDKLTMANVHNYRVQFYSDNNHAIRYHQANSNLYYLLTEFLWESFGGREYMHVRAETHGRFAGPLQDH